MKVDNYQVCFFSKMLKTNLLTSEMRRKRYPFVGIEPTPSTVRADVLIRLNLCVASTLTRLKVLGGHEIEYKSFLSHSI